MMDSIMETSPLKAPSRLLKNPLGMFKRGGKVISDSLSTRSMSSSGSVDGNQERETSSYHRQSSLSYSETDADEDLLVDKFGFIVDAAETETESESVLGSEERPPSVKDFTSMFQFRRSSLMKDKSLQSSQATDAKNRGWPAMLGLDAIIAKKEGLYSNLVAMSQSDPYLDQNEFPLRDEFKIEWDGIERDLKRTFPKHSLFCESQNDDANHEGEDRSDDSSQMEEEVYGKQALRRILRAYCVYDRDIGYCQGMNFIAGMLLMFLTEEESFWLLVVVMNDEPFKLREIFSRDMAGTHEILFIADKLVNCFLPELYEHFENEQVNTSMFTTQWLMTIYTSTFPFELVSKVWDCFIAEGWKIVYKTLIALLKYAQQDGDLLNCGMEQILTYLRSFQSKVDAEQIMSAANKVLLKQRHIQRYASEFRKLKESGEIAVHEVLNRSDTASTSSSMNLSNISKAHRFVIKLKRAKRDVSVQDLSPKLVPVVGSAKFAVLLKNALSPEECVGLLGRAKGEEFQDVVIRQQGGKDGGTLVKFKRSIVEDIDLSDVLYDRVMGALEDIPELWEKFSEASWTKKTSNVPLKASRLNRKLHFLKYGFGDFAAPLRDAAFTRGNEKSYVTMQLYLNNGFKGGVTSFKGTKKVFDVNAAAGDILLFDQELRHEECEVVKGRRYILRTEVMYAPHVSAYQYECTI